MNTLLIYQEIGRAGISSADVVKFLNENKDQDVEIRINSVGGSVSEGIAIYNLLKNHSGNTFGVIDSLCASIATIVGLGCSNLKMNLGSTFMIHNPWTFAEGSAQDMRKTADDLDKFRDQIVSIYMNYFKKSREELLEMMNQETWLSDLEALDLGFVGSIEAPEKISAQIKAWDLKKYFNSLPEKGNQMKEPKEKIDSEVETQEVEKKAEDSAEISAEESTEEIKEEETEEVETAEKEEESSEEAPSTEESSEETTEESEEETEEVEELDEEEKASITEEVMNSTSVKDHIQAQVSAGIQAEMKRRNEIENLAFAGQETLVSELIEEGASLEESALRVIENKKLLDVQSGSTEVKNSVPEESSAKKLLKKMQNSAQKSLNEGSGEEVLSMDSLKKQYNSLKDPKEKQLLVQKMAKLKKEIAS